MKHALLFFVKDILLRRKFKDSFLRSFLNQTPKILDVGCGNNSPSYTKNILPNSHYTGIDISDYNNESKALCDIYLITSSDNFSNEINKYKNSYDIVISNHNLEHCDNRDETLKAMINACNIGGFLFIAFPSERSLQLPSRSGTLNYYDDPTHKGKPPSFQHTINILTKSCEIVFSKPNYSPWYLYFIGLLNEEKSRKANKVLKGTWAYHGFETIIWAKKIYEN